MTWYGNHFYKSIGSNNKISNLVIKYIFAKKKKKINNNK